MSVTHPPDATCPAVARLLASALMRILVADKLVDEGLTLLEQSGIGYDVRVGLKEDELAAAVGKYDALIVRSGAKVTARVLQNPGALKAIGKYPTGKGANWVQVVSFG